MSSNRPTGRKNNPEHHKVARKVANEGIVLLKNENNFFPVTDKNGLTIAVIGENATKMMTVGGGSSELKVQFEISPLEGLKKRFKNAKIIHTLGYSSGSSPEQDSLAAEAVKIAKKADLVLFIGGLNKNPSQDTEGGDRKQYGLPYGQAELITKLTEANKNTGVILISGNAVEMPWADQVKGIVQAWYLGSMTGVALADIISGDVNPSGKLPFSFPVKLSDNAAISFGKSSYPGDSINLTYKEDILVGYRWFDTKKIKPLFAFGHGLSYTTFKLSDIRTDKKKYSLNEQIRISCKITNTGQADGSEVIQVYIGKPDSNVKRALKELKAFRKIPLKKRPDKKCDHTGDIKQLAYYVEHTSGWKIEKGNYNIYIGTASDKIDRIIKINIK